MPEDSRRQHQEQSSLKRATEVERLVFFGDAVFAIVLSALPEEET